jgi:hypothetical protein
LSAIKGFEKAILGQVEAVTEATEAAKASQSVPPEVIVRAELTLPHGVEIRKSGTDALFDRKYQRRTLWVAWLTFAALIAYASISGWQLCEMRIATKATQDAAGAAQSAAVTARTAVEASANQFRQDERPYVWAYPVAGPNNGVLPTIGENIYIRVDFKNSGRTPATNLAPTQSRTIVGPKNEARRQAREFVAEYPMTNGTVFPPEVIGTAPTGYGPKLTDTILGNIKNGSWEVYVVGAVRYRDVFQPSISPYETIYCFSFQPIGLPFGGCDWGGDSVK